MHSYSYVIYRCKVTKNFLIMQFLRLMFGELMFSELIRSFLNSFNPSFVQHKRQRSALIGFSKKSL